MKSSGAAPRFFGWVFMVGFVLFAVLTVVALLENSEQSSKALPGILFFLAVTFVPGFVLLKKAKTLRCKGELECYVMAADRFTLLEAASRIGRSEIETEKWVLEIAAEQGLDLSFDPAKKRFFRRGTVIQAQASEAKCPTCGAHLGSLRFEKGEAARCQYCNAPVRVE